MKQQKSPIVFQAVYPEALQLSSTFSDLYKKTKYDFKECTAQGKNIQQGRLTVDRDPDFRVVVFVGNLPDIKSFRGRVGQEAEEQDDGVRRGKTIRMDLPVNVKNHTL